MHPYINIDDSHSSRQRNLAYIRIDGWIVVDGLHWTSLTTGQMKLYGPGLQARSIQRARRIKCSFRVPSPLTFSH
jgi:hypothetical protein